MLVPIPTNRFLHRLSQTSIIADVYPPPFSFFLVSSSRHRTRRCPLLPRPRSPLRNEHLPTPLVASLRSGHSRCRPLRAFQGCPRALHPDERLASLPRHGPHAPVETHLRLALARDLPPPARHLPGRGHPPGLHPRRLLRRFCCQRHAAPVLYTSRLRVAADARPHGSSILHSRSARLPGRLIGPYL